MTMAIQAVGTLLLLFALVVTPAATAIMLTPRLVMAMAVSTVISVISVWGGLGASAMLDVPPNFLIVTIACGIWLAVWLVSPRVRITAAAVEKSTPSKPVRAPAMAAPVMSTPEDLD